MRYQMSGLGAFEIRTLERMPADMQRWLAEEAKANPEFVTNYLVPVLRMRDPYGQIVEDAAREYTAHLMGLDDEGDEFYEWETGMGKSFFKKVFKKIAKIPVKIRNAAVKALPKGLRKVIKKVGPWLTLGMPAKTFRKYGNIIIGVVGAVLSPFTGGASAAAAALIIAARNAYEAKNKAAAARKAAKAEAGRMEAEAKAAEAQVAKQVDEFYNSNKEWFLKHNIKDEDWAKLTLDQKIDIINAGAKGALPVATGATVPPPPGQSTEPTMAEVDAFYVKYQTQFVAYGVTPDKWGPLTLQQKLDIIRSGVEWPEGANLPTGVPPVTPTSATSAPTAPVSTYVPPTPTQYVPPTPTQYVPAQPTQTPMLPESAQPPVPDQQAAAQQQIDAYYAQNQGFFSQRGLTPDRWAQMTLGQKTDAINAAAASPPIESPATAPPSAAAATAVATGDVSKGKFTVFIEGSSIGTFEKLEDASKAAIGLSTPGDRFEVLASGASTGLRIRTSDGSIDVPADIEEKVRSMSKEQVAAFVAKAEKETSKGAGVPWWLILGGGAAAAAAIL